jgi:hypothetical protein
MCKFSQEKARKTCLQSVNKGVGNALISSVVDKVLSPCQPVVWILVKVVDLSGSCDAS